jgi:hypothetical protein
VDPGLVPKMLDHGVTAGMPATVVCPLMQNLTLHQILPASGVGGTKRGDKNNLAESQT